MSAKSEWFSQKMDGTAVNADIVEPEMRVNSVEENARGCQSPLAHQRHELLGRPPRKPPRKLPLRAAEEQSA